MNLFVFSQVVFAGLAVIALGLLVHARSERRRAATAAYDWLVAAQIAFVLVALPIEQLGYDFDAATNPYWVRLAAFGMVLFPALLARSICSLCGVVGLGARVLMVLSAVLVVMLAVIPTFPGLSYPEITLTFQLVLVGIFIELILATTVSVRALIHVAKGQPPIVRRRAIVLISAQIVFGLTFAGWIAASSVVVSFIANWMMILVGALLIVALVWPQRILRLLESSPRDRWQSFSVLMASTSVKHDLVGILDDLCNTWGLAAAAVIDANERSIEHRGAPQAGLILPSETDERRFGAGDTSIAVWTAPLSIPFSTSDREYLQLLATMIQFALEREEELEQRAAIDASEVAAAKSLADANQRLVEADEMKSRFVSTASHELRTPLTSIIGLARTCSERWDDLDAQQLRDFQDIIVEQGERLERIVDNLLTTSRVDAGMVGQARERVPLRSVIEIAVAGAGAAISDVDIDIDEDSKFVVGDEQAIYGILINLLSNSYKYGAAPFRISTRRRSVQPGSDPVRVLGRIRSRPGRRQCGCCGGADH
ncbi:MAG: HAMP domain-containing sensor histidine kinase [Gaiellales bacterium]